MGEAVIVALITGALTLAGTVISGAVNSSKTIYRIEMLEKKVDKHNNFAEKMPVLELEVNNVDKRLEALERRIYND